MQGTTTNDTIELADGTLVEIRPMAADDGERLLRFHSGLSDRTTYYRFFSVHPHLSDAEVERFTHVDHTAREAFVATVDDEIVAVARFDRLEGSTDAEVAFVVTDVFQGLGLGSALVRRLAARAVELGLRRLVAETLPTNSRMMNVFRHAGLPMTSRYADGTLHVELDLPTAPS